MDNQNLNFSEFIAENFGANATYVETLFNRFRSDPSLVEESWRAYFADILRNANGTDGAPQATSQNNGGAMPITSASAAQLSNGAISVEANGQTATQYQTPPPAPVSQPAQTQATNGQATNGQAAQPASTSSPTPQTSTATAAAPAKAPTSAEVKDATNAVPIRGAALKIVENMEASLNVPTATSNRRVPVKVLEENRIMINRHLQERTGGKASFTHIISWALIKALKSFPNMNDGYAEINNQPSRIKREAVNFGIAVDMQKKDGTRSLLVPNIKGANAMTFKEFLNAYDDVIKRARDSKLEIKDFQETTISITNPGTLGTVASTPRLMQGQAAIIATGAIEYPAEYQAMSPAVLSQLGISKAVNISSTYDHRVIQGAESGAFLQLVHKLLIGEQNFYDEIFASIGLQLKPMRWSLDHNPALLGIEHADEQTQKQAGVFELMGAYRSYGHLVADVDPLQAAPLHHDPALDLETHGLTIWDLDREFLTNNLVGKQRATLREILEILRRAYCGRIGVEYRHIQSADEKRWLRDRIESETTPIDAATRKAILWKLISAEQFERFLHTKFLGAKRFSVEGCETIIPLLDQLIELASAKGVENIVFGMAHRGRLNVLANVMGSFCERIFAAFEGYAHPNFPADEGDVKYHQGAKGERSKDGHHVKLTLSPNPSHLEFVAAPVEGMVRAFQDAYDLAREATWGKALPVLMHGDAAFAGQGVNQETLNLANLKGYRTGGTIHIVINNQIGFTTSPEASRSTIYSTDVAKMTALPIFHVNADDPDAAFRVIKLALDYRREFNKDIVIDLVGFRRLGHNETDEPSYTQPLMYARVKEHEGVRAKYAAQLVREKVLTEAEVKALIDDRVARYENALERAKKIAAEMKKQKEELPPAIEDEDGSTVIETAIDAETVKRLSLQIATVPEGFNVNPKMTSQLAKRAKMGDGSATMDWAFGESMAFGSLVLEGTHVRLSGQDSGRGTFSHRHAVLHDANTGERWTPLAELKPEGDAKDKLARFEVYDSSLSELAVLGFEYGYSVVDEDALVMWEAQFGDFANGAQVIIDQFIASGEDKWKQTCRVVMLLPHGYEGQGPEHSSARLERFLQACAENNLTVCVPTTPAQYFHLLRRQVKQDAARPLVVMTPKSLLRLAASFSALNQITEGGYNSVIDDAEITDKSKVDRVVLCAGKVFYDLNDARKKSDDERVKERIAIIRLEQFYPFPFERLKEVLASYTNAKRVAWTQEEPRNMGGWFFVDARLRSLLPEQMKLRYVGRTPSASPAIGSYHLHELEQAKIIADALLIDEEQVEKPATTQVPDVGMGG